MRIRFSAALASALTITFGTVVVLGLLLNDDSGLTTINLPDFLPDSFPDTFDAGTFIYGLQGMTDILLQFVTITIALTVIIGIFNLLYVHLRRLLTRRKGALYSLILVMSFVLVIVTYVIDRDSSLIMLETVLIAVESSLAGLVLFALVFGAYRMMRNRVTWTGILFVIVLLVVLVGTLPLPGVAVFRDVRDWMIDIPVSAGARGILIGIALATVVTGVRVLIGVDKSYRN